jgi:dihydroorotase-like cyclic amidohydrolase
MGMAAGRIAAIGVDLDADRPVIGDAGLTLLPRVIDFQVQFGSI